MIELKTLGRGAIRRGGAEPEGIGRHKQKFALLTYLAVEERASRERLLAIFWPEREEERARHSLSQALYEIKRELGEDCVRVEGDELSTASDVCTVDARELERAAESEDWETVVELYGGPFLDQFSLAGAPEFEKWQSATRTRLARLARRAFPHVIDALSGRGDASGALATAWHWATLEPLEDEAQHALIQMLNQSGDRSGALEQFEAYRDRLVRELEVEPLEETVALVERIKAGDVVDYKTLGAAPRPAPKVAEPDPAYAAASVGPAPVLPERSFTEKLRERHVFHVGAAYLAVAWLAFQFAGTLADRGVLADQMFPVILVVLAAGLPIALSLAWVLEAAPAMPGEPTMTHRWYLPAWAERLRAGPVLSFLAVLVLVLVAGLAVLRSWVPAISGLDEGRVVVFPLATTPDGFEEDAANMAAWIGYTLESSGRFKWIEGWWELENLQRAGVEDLTPRSASTTARELRAAYYVSGRVMLDDDSVRIRAELHDVRSGEIVERMNYVGTMDATWVPRASENIGRGFLAVLLPEELPIELAAASDTSQAVLEFLDGESDYRNARFAEALTHYQTAVELDSGFALAALKGSMAAGWRHDYETAQSLIDVATRHAAVLEPSRAQLVHGLADFVVGNADDAVMHLRSAVTADLDYVEAWARLGETYQHLLPNQAPIDSLAESAFLEARRRQPEFRPVLHHLMEIAVRRGEIDSARAFLRELEQTRADPGILAENELKFACVEQSAHVIDWREAVLNDPVTVYYAGQSLAKAGAHTGCARAAWSSLIAYATGGAGEAYRFASVMALQSLLVAEGRYDDVDQLWAENEFYAEFAGDFYLLNANAGAPVTEQAQTYADSLRQTFEANVIEARELWMLGVWEFEHGDAGAIRAMADALAATAALSQVPEDRMLAEALEVRAILVAGDSADAIDKLRTLAPTETPAGYWYPWKTLAAEKILLAELLLARGDYAEARRVASTLDAPARPAADLPYLPTSLVIRARAARELGDEQGERVCRERLARLGRTDLLRELGQ
jgi:DNA-binding SARP family transcriptional activator